ncbi:zincin-like metallopeptidase domain-containing protein [Flavobacterium sp.]|uniref:zincin-like metallopeptidase domain-containing protein n=1 Tax=Flavobacterium sp. TaxID=239 RepID=UPI00391C7D1D
MSVINQFNRLGGTIATRQSLEELRDKALLEKPSKQNTELLNRVEKLLEAYPDVEQFELELDNPIKEEFTGLGKIDAIVKGNELVYYQDKVKLATIKENGVITYHKKRLPAGARNEIRKAANIIGLASPYVETPIDESMLHGLEYISEEAEFTGLGKPVSPNDIYNYVTDLIINTIKKVGHLPWQKEWVGGGSENEAKNYVSKKTYNGINFVLLNFDIKLDKLTGYNYLVPIKFIQPYYLTFNQIQEAGATLKAGSKAHRVIYYTMIFGYKNGDLEISTSDKGKYSSFIQSNGITAEQVKEFGKKIPVVKYYNVYRADDCTGLKFPPKPKPKTTSPIEQAQAIIDGYPKPPKYTFVGADAYYQPANDLVNMPKIAAFTKEEFYYSTFFHEIIHSTGHSKRLDRGNDNRKRDGGKEDKKAYAFEELVAELGAVFLCSEAGILFTTVENSAKYLKGWNSRLITELENDNRFFLKASAQAQKAANWILDRNQEKDQVLKTPKAKKITPAKPTVGKKTTKPVTKKGKTVTKKVSTVPKTAIKPQKSPIQVPDLKGRFVFIKYEGQPIEGAESKRIIKYHVTPEKYSQRVIKIHLQNGATETIKSKDWAKFLKGEPIILVNGKQAISIELNKMFNPKKSTIKLTAVQKKRYDKELASDNWKKYSKTQNVANNSKKVSDITKKNENKATIKPKPTQKAKTNKSGKQLKLALAKPIEILASPIQDNIPVYINAPMDDTTRQIVDIIKETVTAEAIVVHQPKPSNKLMQMEFESLPMDNGWEKLMQEPAANMKIAMFGPPKNGKTAAALQLANYLTKFGNVLYNFADQGFNLSTQKLWIESGLSNNPKAEPSDINTLAALEKEIATGKYKFVFIDMISDYIRLEKIKPEEFKANFMRKYPEVSFILIFEVTKAGTFKGDEGWMHVVDAIMNVENFVISNRGRYGFGKRVIWEKGFAESDPKGYAEWLEENTEEVDPEEVHFSEEIERI